MTIVLYDLFVGKIIEVVYTKNSFKELFNMNLFYFILDLDLDLGREKNNVNWKSFDNPII